MSINQIIWPQDRIEHISSHEIRPEEFEEVCFGEALVLCGKSEGQNPVYYMLGQTSGGRYLLCVLIAFPDGNGYPVTARTMTEKEKQRFRKWKNR